MASDSLSSLPITRLKGVGPAAAEKLAKLGLHSLEDLLFLNRDLAYEILWNFVKILSSRLRETNDKMTFLSVTGKF